MCQKRTVFRNYWLTISTTARGAGLGGRYFAVIQQEIARFGTLWPQRVFLFFLSFFYFFWECFNKSKGCMMPVAQGTPHHLLRLGRLLPVCLLWEDTRILRLERLPSLDGFGSNEWLAFLPCWTGLADSPDPSTRTMNALMSWISSLTFQPVLLEDTHTLCNNILIS